MRSVLHLTRFGNAASPGTTELFLPTPVYRAFLDQSGGFEGPFGLTRFPTLPTGTFTFTIAGVNITLTPDQYLITPEQLPNWSKSSKLDAHINMRAKSKCHVKIIPNWILL